MKGDRIPVHFKVLGTARTVRAESGKGEGRGSALEVAEIVIRQAPSTLPPERNNRLLRLVPQRLHRNRGLAQV